MYIELPEAISLSIFIDFILKLVNIVKIIEKNLTHIEMVSELLFRIPSLAK